MSANNIEHCIVFQSKNQEKRLLPWILYHKYQGFDKFIYFDDFSEDNSIEVAKDISKKYDIDLQVFETDNQGDKCNYEQTQNSNSYGGNSSINFRIVRSYNSGIKLIKKWKLNPKTFIAFLDVDEFIVSNSDEKIKNILNDSEHNHLYIQ